MNLLFSILLLFLPLRAESGKFTILQDNKKIGTEDFSITPRAGGYIIEGRTVMTEGSHTLDIKSFMELNEKLEVRSYDFKSATSTINLKVGSPISRIETVVNGTKQGDDVRFPSDGVVLDSNFFHHFAILVYRFRQAPTAMGIPALVPQELQLAPISIKSIAVDTYEIDTGNVKVTATTDKEGKLLKIAVPAAKVVVERSSG
jgi:hypothetical protein